MRTQWLLVCRSRGTPAPEPALAPPFLAGLNAQAHSAVAQALQSCLKGQEKGRELEVLCWAAACTRQTLLDRLQAQGIMCTSHDLFSASQGLMSSAWDMSARLAQLAQHPEDASLLRDALALQPLHAVSGRVELEAQTQPLQADAPVHVEPAPEWNSESVPDRDQRPFALPEPPELLDPFLVTRQTPALKHAPASAPERLQLKLFGAQAAHTLEVGAHRRSSSFLGVQVVMIESARALDASASNSGGYDWSRKLTVQLTPKEMPGATAVLMDLCPSVRFGRHGPARPGTSLSSCAARKEGWCS